MPDCPTNNTDCLPAGSNATDPCSPCFEPTTENFMEVLANLARQVCAVANQVKAWNQTIGKLRNRMNRLEGEIDGIDTSSEMGVVNPCSTMGEIPIAGAEAILACGAGSSVGLVPSSTECSEIIGKNGKWVSQARGLNFHGITPVVILSTTSSGSKSVTLTDFPEDACGDIYAVFQTAAASFEGPSGATTIFSAVLNGYQVFGSGYTTDYSFTESRAKVDSASQSIVCTKTGTGSATATVKLIGYYY